MERHAPSLGDQIARLRGAPAAREKCAWCPAALDALIAAIFARIFGRLEQLLQLWQSGQFPSPRPAPPSTRTPPAPIPRLSRANPPATPAPLARTPFAQHPRAPRPQRRRPAIGPASRLTTPSHPLCVSIRHGRRLSQKKSRLPKPDRRAIFITIS